MAKPPRDIPPEELVQAFMAPAPSEPFEFVRKRPEDQDDERMHVRVQLLRTDETHRALLDAQAYAKTKGEMPKEYGDVYREAQAIEIVWRCFCQDELVEGPTGTKFYRRVFTNAEQCRQALAEPEVAYIINLYEVVKAKFGILEDFSEADIDLWIARLGDGMRGALFLGLLDSRHWPELLLHLARRAQQLCQTLGYQLPSLLDSSESDQTDLESGTSSSGEPPLVSTVSDSGEKERLDLPHDRLVTKDEAKIKAKKLNRRRKKKR